MVIRKKIESALGKCGPAEGVLELPLRFDCGNG